MFCTNCGTEFEGNFCPNCGTKAGEQLPAQTVAPKETHEYYDKEGDLIDLSTIYGVYKDRCLHSSANAPITILSLSVKR